MIKARFVSSFLFLCNF